MQPGRGRTTRVLAMAVAGLFAVGAVVGFVGGHGPRSAQDSAQDSSKDAATNAMANVGSASPSTTMPSAVGGQVGSAGAGSSANVPAMASQSARSSALAQGTVGGAGGSATDEVADVTAGAPAGGGSLPAVGGTPGSQPKIVKDATISVEVKKDGYRQAFDTASGVAGAHGGFVVSSDSNTQKGRMSFGVLVLRVPAAAFDAVRTDLLKLGTVKDEHLTGEDVSGRLVDLDAHIRSLQAQEDALRQLMAKARTIGETIEVQNQLTQVRQQIEQLSGEKARLDDAANLATIRLELAEPGVAATPPPKPTPQESPLADALSTSVRGAETVLAGTIVVLGWALPLALLALIGLAVVRPLRNRVRARAAIL
ncbi:MAG: hypothetical protein QOI20_2440 [Acidimicrobiaceae bacterium]|nr:hypothetical protein [Acidimicrobiaceae bacterium]